MKKILLSLLLLPSLLFAQIHGVSLAEVRAKVLAGNPSVQEAAERIRSAEAVVKQAQSGYQPMLTFNARYGHADASLHPEAYPDIRVSDSFLQGNTSLEAVWVLFDGFAQKARVLSAQYAVEQRQELADETRRMLILSSTVAFRQAQLAQQSLKISDQDLRFNRALEADARKRYDAGEIPIADVHNFTIRALQAENAQSQAQFQYSTACTVLAELMARPEGRLPESMQPAMMDFVAANEIPTAEAEVNYAFKYRPDYVALMTGRRILEEQVRAAEGNLMPRVALMGQVEYTDQGEGYATVGQHGNYNSFAGLALQWDLFAGGRKINTLRQANAELCALDQQIEAQRLSIRSTILRRVDEAQMAYSVLQRQEQIQALSTEVRDSVEKSYRVGAASITRLNEVQTGLVHAEGAYAAALINYQLILNQLEIESGRVLGDL